MNPMKTFIFRMIAASLCGGAFASAQSSAYVNFIRQVQYPGGVEYDASVGASGSDLSQLAIDPGGARFELWTKHSTTLVEHLLSSSYVGTYIPVANVVIRSEDNTAAIPRTRADRPFYVDITVGGLLSGADDPEPSKSVKFLRHVQSYGIGGTDVGIDRTQAILLSQSSINTNGTQNLSFMINSVPGADRAKVRGEERFSIFSLEDYQAPESQIASQYIQVWPVADGSISGIANGEKLRFQLPQVTLTLKDLYPFSTTKAQVYKGMPQPGQVGRSVTGSERIVNEAAPIDETLILSSKDLGEAIMEDGIWTLELITITPFGTERMRDAAGNIAAVWFEVDRTIKLNGQFVNIE
jgi:hypothetical protein